MNTPTKITIIAAVAENGVIGRGNALPWHIPEDLRYFKEATLGKPVVMGRNTWESIGRPLPNRTNIVVTRRPDWSADGAVVAHDLEQAFAEAEKVTAADEPEIAVIGGAELYRAALPLATQLRLTRVHSLPDGDVYFPDWDESQWVQTRCERFQSAGDQALAFSICEYRRAV